MAYGGMHIGLGLQRLIDAQQRYVQNSRYPVMYRMRNFTPQQNTLYAQLGYVITPTGNTGTTDVQIQPPPMTRLVSQHNIGMSAGRLLFGAREFVVSGSFVNAQQSALGLATPDEVWYAPQLVGIYAYSVLWNIAQVAPEDFGGQTILWSLRCNASELK